MNLDELRSVQSTERSKDSLQNLRPSFYQEVGEYIADLEDERDRIAARADDPFASPEVSRLTDEIQTAKDVVEAIYERRMGKLVKQASLAAAGMPADDEGLTAEEQALFSDLVDRIESNKSHVLDVLEGEAVDDAAAGGDRTDESAPGGPAPGADPGGASVASDPADPPPIPPEEPPEPTDPDGLSPADAMGDGPTAEGRGPTGPEGPASDAGAGTGGATGGAAGPTGDAESDSTPGVGGDARPGGDTTGGPEASSGGESSAGEAAGGTIEDVDRVTVRITRDLGSILGVDAREYTLEADDVVTLPAENAAPLVEREAAERLE